MNNTNLNSLLETQSYIKGHEVGDDDFAALKSLELPISDSHCNLIRWYNHMKSFPQSSIKPCPMKPKKPVTNKKVPTKDESKKKEAKAGIKGELSPLPSFLQERLQLWDKLKAEHDEFVAAQPKEEIKVTLPDGAVKLGQSWKTTPFDIASGISTGLAESTVVAKVNGVVWDLERPLEGDCTLELLKFADDEAKTVFWHSTAHILGESLERVYGGLLCYGPPIEEGFYYDMFCEDKAVSNADFPGIEDNMKKMVKEKQPFERLEVKKSDLLKMFEYNPFKVRILNEKVKTDTTTVYRCGTLIDLCRGPHVRHTGKVKTVAVTKSSCAYWEGKKDAESLQRVYGISYPDTKQLKEWQHFQAEAAKRDHRKIGIQQQLFFFNELSPGSCFFTPRGAFIYNELVNLMKDEYSKRGFQEVVTPNIYNTKLWETSGHWQHYEENMFSFDVEKEKYALKPMNCPGHCIIFGHTVRSWKELPIRMADFGVLHRNEFSGALTGLTRVRRFQQDDAHIFCTTDMIKSEMKGCLEFLSAVYEIFGFKFNLQLSTRPEKFLGEIAVWDAAEAQLKESLNDFTSEWKLNPGDGAFYGPKIDITVTDALRRHHQCATIQLDFQLPERFDLNYVSETGDKKRPVIIHRAILGSVERMIAILTENYGGKWPFWLSPRQCMVVPVNKVLNDYAKDVRDQLRLLKFQADCDIDDSNTMNKKIRDAQMEQYNFIFVVGEKEFSNKTLNVRTRDNKIHGEHSIDHVKQKLDNLRLNRTTNWEDAF